MAVAGTPSTTKEAFCHASGGSSAPAAARTAAGPMRDWFDNMQVHTQRLRVESTKSGTNMKFVYGHIYECITRDYWPQGVVQGWLDYAELAMEKIAPLETSEPARYKTLYDAIALERLSPIFIMNELYKNDIPSSALNELRRIFAADVLRLGITTLGEGGAKGVKEALSYMNSWNI